jgi:pimeloyl-ACP methyl ester carboxylesterase
MDHQARDGHADLPDPSGPCHGRSSRSPDPGDPAHRADSAGPADMPVPGDSAVPVHLSGSAESAVPGVRTVVLPDARVLAVVEWGDPDGFPAFYFHGTPGSRLEGAFADGAARRHGFRLIAMDRLGFGRSTFQAGRRFRDWPRDVCALADRLQVREFGVVGHSGGGPRTSSPAVRSYQRIG